jgi:8-oxo-dGTP pyrophosphatase MutT (NUDIX family)
MHYKLPVSALVVVYAPDLRVLLLERADYPEHWQSVTGSQEPGETLLATATRELREETGIDAALYGGVSDWHLSNVFDISTTIPAIDIGVGAVGFLTHRIGVCWDVRRFQSVGGNTDNGGLSFGGEHLSFWRATMAVVIRY